MKLFGALGLAAFLGLAQAAPKTPTFENATIVNPDGSTSYARAALLEVGNTKPDPPILATYAGSDHFDIYRSTDGGRTWKEISKAYFTNGNYTGGIILQPFLYELPEDFGEFSAGTVFLSGNAIPHDFSSS